MSEVGELEAVEKDDDAAQAWFDALIERVRALPEPTERERETQTLSFAHGNLALSTNHKPSRRAFAQLAADRYGWSLEEFNTWADTVKWEIE